MRPGVLAAPVGKVCVRGEEVLAAPVGKVCVRGEGLKM